MSGENYSPASEFETRAGYTWIDATHLVGHAVRGRDRRRRMGVGAGHGAEVGQPHDVPRAPYLGPYAGRDLWVITGSGPRSCSSPALAETVGTDDRGERRTFDVPVLCDVLGVVGSEILLGHWNSDRSPGDWNDPNDGNGTVVALDIHGADPPFEDPALRRVVVTAGAPERVTFATDLIGEALDADGGAS